MDFQLSYAGFPLPLAGDQDTIDWVNQHLPVEKIADVLPPPEWQGGRNLRGLAVPQWPAYPSPLKVGNWFYPVGASRWSILRTVCDEVTALAIMQAMGGANGLLQEFVMYAPVDNEQDPVITPMWCLPPQVLGRANVTTLGGLYLLTLVDERYLWQFLAATVNPGNQVTWQDCLDQIISATGASITWTEGAPNPDYGNGPEADSDMWANAEQPGPLLDSIAFNTGCIVIRNFDGSYELQPPVAAQSIILDNRALLLGSTGGIARLAGGANLMEDMPGNQNSALVNQTPDPAGVWTPLSLVVPASVTVSFPQYISPVDDNGNPTGDATKWADLPGNDQTKWILDSYRSTYDLVVSIDDLPDIPLDSNIAFDGSRVFHETAKAAFNSQDDIDGGGDPTNLDDMTTLAQRIASNYYQWLIAGGVREVYPGIVSWQPEGAHDVLWTYRIDKATTEVIPLPWNFGPNYLQHDLDVDINEVSRAGLFAKITGAFSDGYPWVEETPNDGDFSDTPNGRNSDDDGTAFELNDDESVAIDTIVFLEDGGDGHWYFNSGGSNTNNMAFVMPLQTTSVAGVYRGGTCQPNRAGLTDRHLHHLVSPPSLISLSGSHRCYALKSLSNAPSFRWSHG